MQQAGIAGVHLAWRDVLHAGPVPMELELAQLSRIRAQYIVEQAWGDPAQTRQDFIDRDNTLASLASFDRIILWFEHDLYDQLQLLQVLDWLQHHAGRSHELSMICVDRYLGMLSPDQMRSLFRHELAVTANHLALASRAWSAFRAATPEGWYALLQADTGVLPFLHGAIVRLLEEYPACRNGLSRTASRTLEIIRQGEKNPGRIFARYQQTEERRFLGDTVFWSMLRAMLASSPPLLQLTAGTQLTLPFSAQQELALTETGAQVLGAKKNWCDIHTLDHWIGGVHLTSANAWCWDADSATLVKCTCSPLAGRPTETSMKTSRKQRICALLKGIETGDTSAVAVVNEKQYIQHNPQTHEGSEGLAELFQRLSKTSPRVNIVRVFEDGDYVFAHTEYDFAHSNIGFEVFRFEHDQAVEHWDNIQPRMGPNASAHDMVGGPAEASDLQRTEQNRELVSSFVREVLINRQFDRLERYIDGANYTEHNPRFGDGLSALRLALSDPAGNGGIRVQYDRAHRILAQGNFVLTVCEGFQGDVHSSMYDLFRIAQGRIVEHWDTTEAVPPPGEWKNDNGKF